VQLSKHDLAQLDEAALAALTPEQLRALSCKLLADLKLARERLEQNPRNSSRPPSSVAPWERFGQHDDAEDGESDPAEDAVQAPAADAQRPDPVPAGDAHESAAASAADRPAQAAEPPDASAQTKPGAHDEPSPRRRPGRQPGAPGHGRTQPLPIDHEVTHAPSHCARCGGELEASAATRCVSAHRMLELREAAPGRHVLEVIEIKHVYYERDCGCGHCTRAEPGHTPADASWGVALSERHLVGARLTILICAMALRLRLSRRRIREFLIDWLGVALSVGSINQCIHEGARAAEPVVEEQLLAELRIEALVHADETSWFEGAQLLWLWVFTSATTTVFSIGRRVQAVLFGVLGEQFDGWLMSDGYWAYRDYNNRLRCLAHIVRKARGLEESLDRQGQQFGKQLRACLKQVMRAVYAAREGPPPMDLRQQHADQLQLLWRLCLEHADAAHEKTRALARELLNDWDTFWVVLDHPELPLTNNLAERMLRHWVIARRIGFGTRNAQGSRTVAVLASVIETCRQRQHSPWDFLTEVLRARRQGLPAPRLPAAA
jgi:hypothetical protein